MRKNPYIENPYEHVVISKDIELHNSTGTQTIRIIEVGKDKYPRICLNEVSVSRILIEGTDTSYIDLNNDLEFDKLFDRLWNISGHCNKTVKVIKKKKKKDKS